MANEINIEIDIFDFEKGSAKFNLLLEKYEDAIQDAIEEIMYKAEQKLYENLTNYGLMGSELSSDCGVRQTGDYSFEVYAESDHAMFVEFGTGIVGENNPHPDPKGWVYDTKGKGEEGWWYPTDNPYPGQRHFISDDGTLLAWTRGQEARPYMYDTYRYIRRIVTRTINKHLGRIKV